MRKPIALTGLVLLATGCGGPANDNAPVRQDSSVAPDAMPAPPPPPASQQSTSERLTTFDAQERAAGPNVAPSAAPGVAFNYSYAFRLEADRIAAVQERHAAMCEQLGIGRCRITGMLYRVVSDENIEARLELKLDPSIARHFGREGVGVVTQNDGRLVESRISGTDAGSAIRRAGRSIADMEADLRRIEGRLAGRLSQGERESLELEAQQLRQSIRAQQQNREDVAETLATTPMTFVYGSGDFVPGTDRRRPVRDALDQAGRNFVDGAAVLFVLLVTLLPWAFAALLAWLLYRTVRRWRDRREAAAEAAMLRADAAAAEPAGPGA